MKFTSSLVSADREKTPVHFTGSCNERPPITTVIYVHSRPVLSTVVTNIGFGLPEGLGPLWSTGVIAGGGKELQGAMIYHHDHSQEAIRSSRTHFTVYQRSELEKIFRQSKYISALKRTSLSQILGIPEKAIQNWFKNRRVKWRKEKPETGTSSASIFVTSGPYLRYLDHVHYPFIRLMTSDASTQSGIVTAHASDGC